MKFEYTPSGVCSRKYIFDIDENNIIQEVTIYGGCNGNLQGISHLIKGLDIDTVIDKLTGIKCGPKDTSCPDQIAKALASYKESK